MDISFIAPIMICHIFNFSPLSPLLKGKIFKGKDFILFIFVFPTAQLVPSGVWRHGVNISGLSVLYTRVFSVFSKKHFSACELVGV